MLEGRRMRLALTALLLSSAALFAIGVAKERHDIKHERARAVAAAAALPPRTTTGPTSGGPATTRESAKPRGSASGESTAKRAAEGTGVQTTTNPASTGESAAKRKSEGTGAQTTTNPASTGESTAKLASEGGVESAARLRSEGSSERVFGINTESTALVVSAVAVSALLALAVWLAPGLAMVLLVVLGLGIASSVFDVREAAHQATEHRDTLEGIAIVVAVMHVGVAALAVGMLRSRPERRPATV